MFTGEMTEIIRRDYRWKQYLFHGIQTTRCRQAIAARRAQARLHQCLRKGRRVFSFQREGEPHCGHNSNQKNLMSFQILCRFGQESYWDPVRHRFEPETVTLSIATVTSDSTMWCLTPARDTGASGVTTVQFEICLNGFDFRNSSTIK